jgi:hypothetical protein
MCVVLILISVPEVPKWLLIVDVLFELDGCVLGALE